MMCVICDLVIFCDNIKQKQKQKYFCYIVCFEVYGNSFIILVHLFGIENIITADSKLQALVKLVKLIYLDSLNTKWN